MNIARITPRLLWTALLVSLGVRLLISLPALFQFTPPYRMVEIAHKTGVAFIAYAIAALLSRRIADEYRNVRWLRWAWLALAGNAIFSMLRMVVESPLFSFFQADYLKTPLAGYLQHLAIVPANVCLFAGLLTMWWAYSSVGLGFKLERRDYVFIGGILLLLVALLSYREALTEANSPILTARYLQQIGLILLSLSAATSIALHRMAQQMGGGQLAVVLRMLSLYTCLRLVFVLLQAFIRTEFPFLNHYYGFFIDLGWLVMPWLAALASAYRTELTAYAAQALGHRSQNSIPPLSDLLKQEPIR